MDRALAELYNRSLRDRVHPTQWRHGLVRAMYKGKGLRSDPSKYRPITVTPAPGRVMEGLMADRLLGWLEQKGWLTDAQEGFRSQRGCLTALTHLSEEWWRLTDPGLAAGTGRTPRVTAVALDMAKAFDRIDRELLLFKVRYGAGVTGNTLGWIASMLEASWQRIQLRDGTRSEELVNRRGTPQGNCLSPLLFLIWVNDIPGRLRSRRTAYADDLTIWSAAPTIAEQHAEVQQDLTTLEGYCNLWGTELQAVKCAHLELGRTHTGKSDGALTYGGAAIPRATCFKLLGLWFDDNLSWDLHVRRQVLAPLRRQRHYLGWLARGTGTAQRLVMHRCYTGVVRPRLEYGAELWGTAATNRELLEELDSIELELVRVMIGAPTRGVAEAAVRAEAGVERLSDRRQWAKVGLLSRIAALGPRHRLGQQWRQRLQDREPSRFFREAARDWHRVATPRLTLSFGTERFRAELRRARTEAADLALEQDQRATVVALRRVKPTTRPWRHTMLGRRRSCQVAAQLRMDVAPLAPRLRHFTEVPTAECTNCGATSLTRDGLEIAA